MKRLLITFASLAAVAAVACGPGTPSEPQFPALDGQAILKHVEVLSLIHI